MMISIQCRRVFMVSALLIAAAVAPQTVAQPTYLENEIVIGSDTEPQDRFAYSCSMSGNLLLVGAPRAIINNGVENGVAYLFEYDAINDEWVERQKIVPNDLVAGLHFGARVDLDAAAGVALIGTYMGYNLFFRYDADLDQWVEEQKLYGPENSGGLGVIEGDLAVMGRPGANGSAGNAIVYRFNRDMKQWEEMQTLVPSAPEDHARFGAALALSGDSILFGAPYHSAYESQAGAAFLFRFDEDLSAWVEEQMLVSPEPAESGHFGWAVALQNDVAVVGSPDVEFMRGGDGAAYVYRWDGARWSLEQRLASEVAGGSRDLGTSLDIQGNTIVAAAPDDLAYGWIGSVSAFQWNGSDWIQRAKLIESDSDGLSSGGFGAAVAVCNDRIVAGVNPNNQQDGRLFMYDLEAPGQPLPRVEFEGACPGLLTVRVSDLSPGDRVVLLYGDDFAPEERWVPGCPELMLNLGGLVLGRVQGEADENGEFMASGTFTKASWCRNVFFQAVNLNACTKSQVAVPYYEFR